MSDTPETDKEWRHPASFDGSERVVHISVAQKRERERDEAWKFLREATKQRDDALEELEVCVKERDEAQKILSSIYRWIERNHQDGFLDSLTYEENLERIHDTLFDRLASETDNAEYYRERYEQLKDKLAQERDEAREELAEAKRESENLARSIYRTEYSDNDTGWELLESVAGVISQIDNMYAGVREQRDEAREDAAHWKTEYEIVVARLCGKKHPRDNGIFSEHEIIPKLTQERDEAREVLKTIASWQGGLGAKWPQEIARDFLASHTKEGAK